MIVVIGFYFFLLSPLLQSLNEQAQAREDKQAQLEEVQQRGKRARGSKAQLPEIERQLLELSKRSAAQIPTLVVQVQEIADAAGATQLVVEPEMRPRLPVVATIVSYRLQCNSMGPTIRCKTSC